MYPRETPRPRTPDSGALPRLPLPAGGPLAAVPPSAAATMPVPRTAPLPPALTRPVSVLSLVQSLRRRWVLAVSLGLVVGAIATLMAWRMLPASKYAAYTARSIVRVHAVQPKVLGTPAQGDFNAYKSTLMTYIRSKPVLDEVLRDPSVRNVSLLNNASKGDVVEFLRNEIQIDGNMGPEILRISMSGEPPEDLATIVNAVTNVAITKVTEGEKNDKRENLHQLRGIQQKYEQTLSSRKQKLVTMAKAGGGSVENPWLAGLQVSTAQATLQLKEAQLDNTRNQIRITQIQIQMRSEKDRAKPKPPADKPAVAVPSPLLDDPDPVGGEQQLQALLTQLLDLRKQIDQITRIAKDEESAKALILKEALPTKMAALTIEIGKVRAKTRSDAASKTPTMPTAPGEVLPPDFNVPLEQLQTMLAFHKQNEKVQEEELNKVRADLTATRNVVADMEELANEIKAADEMNKVVNKWFEEMSVEMLAGDRVKLIEAAEVPTTPEERRTKFAALTGLAAFAFVLFGVGFLEFASRKIHRLEDVANGLAIPVVGTQPLGAGVDAMMASKIAWYDLPNDGVDATRALLIQSSAGAPRVVVVTSAIGGEGTTSVACNLAASLARAGRRTLLIDANLRKPETHRAFGVENKDGLGEVLRGELAATAVVQAAPLDRLWLMTAGKGDLQAVQGLSRDVVFSMLEQLKRDYEFLVIDAAPVVPTADSLLLAQRADAVLLSVLAGTSRTPTVFSAWQRLTSLGARLPGAVVQGATDDTSSAHAYPFQSRA